MFRVFEAANCDAGAEVTGAPPPTPPGRPSSGRRLGTSLISFARYVPVQPLPAHLSPYFAPSPLRRRRSVFTTRRFHNSTAALQRNISRLKRAAVPPPNTIPSRIFARHVYTKYKLQLFVIDLHAGSKKRNCFFSRITILQPFTFEGSGIYHNVYEIQDTCIF